MNATTMEDIRDSLRKQADRKTEEAVGALFAGDRIRHARCLGQAKGLRAAAHEIECALHE